MCGIFCAFGKTEKEHVLKNLHKSCKFYIDRRGPDFQREYRNIFNIENNSVSFIFSASVLWLQGEQLTEQPLCRENSIFLFNGDVFEGISDADRKRFGDADLLLNQLETANSVSVLLSKINGPYSFVYFDKVNLKLYFGCDIFGRRSLLITKSRDILVLSSVVSKDILLNFIEVPPIGTFCINFKTNQMLLYPWAFRNGDFHMKLGEIEAVIGEINVIQDIPLRKEKSFIEPSSEDLKIFKEIEENQTSISPFHILLENEMFLKNVTTLKKLLARSVEIRISNQPKFCQKCIILQDHCDHATIGILFSGGVDCTILAVFVDKYYDRGRPIDLINVAFDRGNGYDTPDRKSGKQSWEELRTLCPQRRWNFVEVNVTQEELNKQRSTHIRHLIHPLNRILDDSLGCALWFAAMGVGEAYSTSCRVLLVGMGADELFGGYCRQRRYFKENGWQGLYHSLNEDWQSIPQRNLARDDRVVSDQGRQLRTPYLDEHVVKFARNLNCWEKTYPSEKLPRGLGEKILLRTLAYNLGLRHAALLKKKALQFGSRIANSKENAFDVSPRL